MFDGAVGVAAADEAFGEVEDLVGVADAVEVEAALGAEDDVAAVEIDVGADADVVDGGEFGDVIDVIEDVIDGYVFGVADEGADHGEADDAAFGGQAADGFVGLAAGGAGDQGAAVGVGDNDGGGGGIDGVQGCPIAAVGDIDGHADGVHTGEDLLAERGEAGVGGAGGTAADAVGEVGQLRDALAAAVELVDVGGGAEVFGVLQADEDAELSGLFGLAEIGGGVDALELVGMGLDESVPAVYVTNRLGIDVAGKEADGGVEDCGAGVFETLEIGGEETGGVGFPGGELSVVEGEQTQHVDDGGALDEVERAGGIGTLARGMEGELAAIVHGCGNGGSRTVQCRTAGNHGV